MTTAPAARPSAGLFADARMIDTIADLFANVWQLGYVTTGISIGRSNSWASGLDSRTA